MLNQEKNIKIKKDLIKLLGFFPKENAINIFNKKYLNADNYVIEIDFKNKSINYGDLIQSDNKTTQNFLQDENWIVLECVDRLIEKGYHPKNIILEKTWKTGHGTSGRLDILITRNNKTAYMMIECKTWGKEFEKELKNLNKNGGQLFTYFQQDKNADILMLYSSKLDCKSNEYVNKIIKIEESYRETGNVKDFFERWNKTPKSNGIFESWTSIYDLQSKALIKNDLKILKQEDSSFIFNRFLEILRHNVVSDKPNAFNKIFTLFLCKIVDENKSDDEQLDFQWIEGEDNNISFQKRLTDLYSKGMLELLEKKVADVNDKEFDEVFENLDDAPKKQFKEMLTKIRLKKNNEFAIKEVYDDGSFEENAIVVREIVELLQVYKLRYNYRQQFLSDFFELLLTTGLKQESGQFFTPVPIARFIVKSLPIQEIISKKIETGNRKNLLPKIIDYAVGSGHFITEAMEEIQKYVDIIDENKFNPTSKRSIKKWKSDQFDWAEDYIYGIEKDYRLVKTAKVSCYLHGDGLAKVIHGDGLDDFKTSKDFKDLLKETDIKYSQDNKQFDVIVSNPPYSVSSFKGSMVTEEKAKKAFELYDRLTDQSSEIECLFIERTKQLLKDGGVAGIILPSSILSNTGIYTQTREIILKYFEIIAIAELGSNTFMATGTNTVTLFLRRKNNTEWLNIKKSVGTVFLNQQDLTINSVESPINKYIAHTWEDITFNDYKTLLDKSPNRVITKHEIYIEYKKKITVKNKDELYKKILKLEQEKLLYFIIAYPQRIVLVKTGQKKEEKQFLGYEFSNRRGSEGIHPIQRSKTIDECTKLYDINAFDNPEKASTYIYKAFENKLDLDIPENLKNNISYHNLVDMMTFDRADFEKNISLSVKKKIIIESKWGLDNLGDVINFLQKSKRPASSGLKNGIYPFFSSSQVQNKWLNIADYKTESIIIGDGGNSSIFISDKFSASDHNFVFHSSSVQKLTNKYIYYFFKQNFDLIVNGLKGSGLKNISKKYLMSLKLPVPPLDIQKKIVAEIGILEEIENGAVKGQEELKESICSKASHLYQTIKLKKSLGSLCDVPVYGANEKAIEGKALFDYRYIRITDINKDGYLNNDFKTAQNVSNKYILKNGDLLFARSGATAGKTFLYDEKYGKALYAGYLIKFNVNSNVLNYKFLNFILKSNEYQNWVISMRKGSAQPNINAKQFSNFQIPLLSLSEQKKIVSEIEKIENKISILEEKIKLIPQQKEAILKKYLN